MHRLPLKWSLCLTVYNCSTCVCLCLCLGVSLAVIVSALYDFLCFLQPSVSKYLSRTAALLFAYAIVYPCLSLSLSVSVAISFLASLSPYLSKSLTLTLLYAVSFFLGFVAYVEIPPSEWLTRRPNKTLPFLTTGIETSSPVHHEYLVNHEYLKGEHRLYNEADVMIFGIELLHACTHFAFSFVQPKGYVWRTPARSLRSQR